MSETKHTPLPWKAGIEDREIGDGISVSAGGSLIAEVIGSDCFPFLQGEEVAGFDLVTRANAAFIVRACNSFGDLLDFVKTLENDNGKIPAWLWDKRNALIAKAEGRDQ